MMVTIVPINIAYRAVDMGRRQGMDERRRRLCKLIVDGMPKAEAGIAAGYSKRTAGQIVSRVLREKVIKDEIARLRAERDATVDEDEKTRLKDHYDSSLDLLRDVYNNPKLPFSIRYKAAADALPYEHGKIGPKGKKGDLKEDAAKVGNGRFAVGKRPTLRSVS